ncbi:hypothetical protein [Geomonas ferrireducens]|jgi:hypothetical protein|uniref:hypothetical protein n=1 Tax=Geomonas ferrireducens TaxID=2570227 RepID=UPI0010A8E500|nr:hypothetical protein [Geomonas ferrireducens]
MKKLANQKAKIVTCSIIGLVLAGAAMISGVVDLSGHEGTMSKVFFLFLGAVIVVQVIPGLMLLGAMLKGVYSLVSKKSRVPVETDTK